MRIVVLGDIHGNLLALEAALAAAGELGYDRIVHTGDLVGYGPRPNETIDLIRERKIEGVRGNFDASAAWDMESPYAEGDPRDKALADTAHRWTVGRLGYSQKNFLKDVPFSVDQRIGSRFVSVFHASPSDLYSGIDEETPDGFLRGAAEETGADLHIFGHTHEAFHRVVDGTHFVNAGSVGCPTGGDARACLAVVDVNGSVKVEFRRVAYDVEAAARETETAGLPRDIAERLRKGR